MSSDYSMQACRKWTLDNCERYCRQVFHIATLYPEELTEDQWRQIADARDWLDAIYRKREKQIQEEAA